MTARLWVHRFRCLMLFLAIASPASAEDLDWCAPVVVRPDQAWLRGEPACTPRWTKGDIASHADVVYLYGDIGNWFTGGSPEQAFYHHSCFGEISATNLATYMDEVNRLRPPGKMPIKWVIGFRWDLVTSREMTYPGFSPEFLSTTNTPWGNVLAFFKSSRDATSCGGALQQCAWDDRNLYYGHSNPPACGTEDRNCLRYLINAAAGQEPATGTAYENKVYYQGWDATLRHSWPKAAVADQRNTAYRSWKVGLAQKVYDELKLHGDVYVDLNHKLHFYYQGYPASPRGSSWLGSPACSSVEILRTGTYECPFTAKISDYSYSSYVGSLRAIASELRSRRIPFSFFMAAENWCDNPPVCSSQARYWDDPSTAGVNEADVLRSIAMTQSSIVMLRRSSALMTRGVASEKVVPVVSAGSAHPYVVSVSESCGLGRGATPAPP